MKIQNKKGQVLLIAVMMLATIITVVMTIAFNSTTETQVARLEADSQKALAAAEAGIDAVIKQSATNSTPFNVGSLPQFSEQKITGNAQVTAVSNPYFVTPLLQKDEQYTFYLSDYLFEPPAVPQFNNPWSGKLNIYLVSEKICPSIEVTIVDNTNTLVRYAYNTCSSPPTISNTSDLTIKADTTIDTVLFRYKIRDQLTISNGRVAFIRVLGERTKLGFQGYTDDGVTPKSLPSQGKTIISEARTATGVVKKVQLFQSFPQIPSNFFTTSF